MCDEAHVQDCLPMCTNIITTICDAFIVGVVVVRPDTIVCGKHPNKNCLDAEVHDILRCESVLSIHAKYRTLVDPLYFRLALSHKLFIIIKRLAHLS